MNVLKEQHGEFPVYLELEGAEVELQLKITEASIRVKTLPGDKYLKFDYSVGSPAIELSLKDTSRLIMSVPTRSHDEFGKFVCGLGRPHRQGQPFQLELRFVNRFSRDVLLFAHKVFSAKKELKSAHLLNSLEHPEMQGEQFNYLVEMESLRYDLYRLIVANAKLLEEKEFYRSEVERLQDEMAQVRDVYTRLLEGGVTNAQQAQQFDRNAAQLGISIMGAPQQLVPPAPLSAEQTQQFNLQGMEAITNLLNLQSPNPLQKLHLDRSFAQMISTLLPPPSPAPEQLLDPRAAQSAYQSLFGENVQLRDHINKLSCEVAWFYSQHGQPTLPLRLRYRISQEKAIQEEPSVQEKSRTR